MRRFPAGLARLLSLLLVLQWASATLPHARALAALGGATAVELCSAHGARTVLVDRDGQPLDGPDRQGDEDCCALCLPPAASLPPGPAVPSRLVAYAPVEAMAARPGLPPLPPRAPPQLPRAPPQA